MNEDHQAGRAIIELKPGSYQPGRAELQEPIACDCRIDAAVDTRFQQVVVKQAGVD